MITSHEIAEGVRAGLIRVEFTAPTGPRQYIVKISNGSGVKAATVTASRQSIAVDWAVNWAKTLGAGWAFLSVIARDSDKLARR